MTNEKAENIEPVIKTIKNGKPYYTIRKIKKPETKIFYRIVKRLFDIFVGIIGTLFLIVPFIVVAIVIKCDSKGPVFYKQERLRENDKKFMLYKFRSMKTDAEKNGAQWADDNDDRCTKVGSTLRKFRIDELPQIPFNILLGSISIVGPRPERECFYEEFATYIDGFEQRLYVKPGLTGWAQINGGYDLKPEEKVVYDLEYIERRSILMDLKIMFKTAIVVFNHDGAR